MAYPSYEEINQLQYKLSEAERQYWIQHDLFSPQWWLLLFSFMIPLIIWHKIIPKAHKARVLTFGLLIGIFASQLDSIGLANGAWGYRYQLFYHTRALNPYNFSLIPVGYMIVYHYFPKWKHFIIGNLTIATIATFIAGPFFEWIGIYEIKNWERIYSFPIYFAMPVVFRWVVRGLIGEVKKVHSCGKDIL